MDLNEAHLAHFNVGMWKKKENSVEQKQKSPAEKASKKGLQLKIIKLLGKLGRGREVDAESLKKF